MSDGFNGAPTTWSGIGARGEVVVDGLGHASTGPRPRGRGSSPAVNTVASGTLLQRGPDHVVGDRSAPIATGTCSSPLQRGPDHVVGDRLPLRRTRRSNRCFNGAPTTWSGIGEPERGGTEVGNAASTGPRPRGRGSLGCTVANAPPHTCFNGAPTTWSGIVGASEKAGSGTSASTGPRPRGRGSASARRWRPVPPASVASTGPRPRGRGSANLFMAA